MYVMWAECSAKLTTRELRVPDMTPPEYSAKPTTRKLGVPDFDLVFVPQSF